MKSVMGELTDSTNRAEGFSLMPVVWATGATLGYVHLPGFRETSNTECEFQAPDGWDLIKTS